MGLCLSKKTLSLMSDLAEELGENISNQRMFMLMENYEKYNKEERRRIREMVVAFFKKKAGD